MMSFLIAEIFLKAAVLCLILFGVARNEADYGFQKVAMVTAGIALGGFLLEAFIPFFVARVGSAWLPLNAVKILGGLGTLVGLLVFVAFMVVKFCWVSARRAWAVAAVYLVFCICFALATRTVKARFSGTSGMAEPPAVSRINSDLKDVAEFQKESFDLSMPTPDLQPPAESVPDAVLPVAETGDATTNLPVESAPPPHPVVVEDPLPSEPALPALIEQAPAGAAAPDVDGARKLLKINGFIRNSAGRPLALVNQQPIEVGESVSLLHQGFLFKWRLDNIQNGRVSWTLLEVNPAPNPGRKG